MREFLLVNTTLTHIALLILILAKLLPGEGFWASFMGFVFLFLLELFFIASLYRHIQTYPERTRKSSWTIKKT